MKYFGFFMAAVFVVMWIVLVYKLYRVVSAKRARSGNDD